jgi:NAD(P)-dependent dehydrogenase (short-subunit alcohol dehydrogenase family)
MAANVPVQPVVVVTGAGSGLGRCLAVSLAGKGYRLTLVGRDKERLEQTQAALGDTDCLTLALDVTAAGSGESIVDETLNTFNRIDAVVNNAGMARLARLEQLSLAEAEAMMRTNLIAPVFLIHHAVPALRESQGTVVNVGSIGGLLSVPSRALYGASKAALHHVTRSLARELAPDVRVNAVLPGAIDTPMYDDLGCSPEEVARLRRTMVDTTPLGRFGTPEDVVPWIELLLGPAGRWVTGSLFVIDGGRSC